MHTGLNMWLRWSLLLLAGFTAAHPQYAQYSSDYEGMFRQHSARGTPAEGKKGIFLMNRIGPSTSTLYIANADGSNSRRLLGNDSRYEYHGSWTPDGQSIILTSERNGDGQSDLYRINVDGTGLEELIASPSIEDAGVLSPNGKTLAYVSTANGYKTNIWLKDLETGVERNLTNTNAVKGVSWSPDGYFSPAWSPDGQWLAFSSDRNTGWYGHGNGSGWEHTQSLSIYVIRPNGSGFHQVVTKGNDYTLGAPKWSPDGRRIVFYEMPREYTWNAHRPEDINSTVNQIASVDFATGLDYRIETNTSTLKIAPSYVANGTIGYLVKGPTDQIGLHYTSSSDSSFINSNVRSPSWSPDGSKVVYEITSWSPTRPMEKPLYSWDEDWYYRFTDVFPVLSAQGELALTQKQLGNSSIVKMYPDGQDLQMVFDVYETNQVEASLVKQGLSGAFQPDWSPDGTEVVFGLGAWFQERAEYSAWIYRVSANGSEIYTSLNGTKQSFEQLTFGSLNAGFPSYSHDGNSLVYRVWGTEYGLRIINLTDRSIRVLTNGTGDLNSTGDIYDNLPHYNPPGTLNGTERILFTRRMNATNFDICTINPDGSDLKVLTTSGANDAHAVWTSDGRIMWSTGMHGFQMECAAYDQTFQPYGMIYIMDADGENKRALTNSLWEDSMPLYVPNEVLY